jgi:tetratricopeptide (TPR) repeat protein
MAGTIMGTPAFMSPEQHLGEPADARSDQFSFCVALYGALYGQAAFAGLNLIELGENVIEGRLRPPPADTPVPAWVFEGLRVGLATSPDDRHPSMDTLLAALTPDQVTMSRRRWQWPAALVGVSALAVIATLAVVGGADPSGADLEAIERLTLAARDAADRMQWVYPTPEDPRDTAYNRIVLLENLGGAATEPAFAAATGLRAEFAEALVVLGDRYFDDPQSRPFARDYYVQALVFMPTDPRASERSGVTLGQIGDLQARAAQGDFAEDELLAAEPLRILADPDSVHAHDRALAYARDVARGSALGRERAATVFRKSGLLTPGELAAPSGPPAIVAVAEPPPPVTPAAPVAVAEPVIEEPLPTRLERDRRLKLKPVDDSKPAPPPPPEPEPGPAASDPDASRGLSEQGSAARRRGETQEAEQLYNQALDLWNGNAAALIGLSDIHFERGDFDRAVKYAEKGVRADASAENLIRLGDAYFKVFRYTDAQQRYQRAAALGHPRAEERLARVREKLGG